MPSTVSKVFASAGLTPVGVVRWGEPVPGTRPGVYAVALDRGTGSITGVFRSCPIDEGAVSELLQVRPELRVDGRRPTTAELVERLAALWLGNETVVYIGLAGTSLRDRINDYYRTPLGARSRHSGGWPLKTLGVLSLLWVHYAPCPDPVAAEHQMLNVFAAHVSPETRTKLKDPAMPVPFANLEHAKGHRKRHGITGTRAPRKPSPVTPERVDKLPLTSGPETSVRTQTPESVTPRKHTTPTTVHPGPMRSQRITDKDIQAGQVRFPASAKPVFPPERAEVAVSLRGEQLAVPWNPRYDSDRERSGVLSIGHQRLAALVQPGDVLSVGTENIRVRLD